MSELTHLSYSSISTWLMCPRSWRYRYVDKVPAPKSPALVFGSAFHDAVEAHVRDQDDTPLAARWSQCWAAQLERDGEVSWDKEPTHYEDLGAAMLSAPDVVALVGALTALKIEEKITLNVPGVPVPIIGYIDMIETDGVPADFKTSARSWSQKKADDEMQATFYLAALNQSGHKAAGQFRYYVFVKNARKPQVQIWETHRTARDMFWLFGLIGDVWHSIERGAFPPNPTTWKCSPKWCEYWDGCRG